MRKFLVLVATWFVLCGGVVVAQQVLPGFPPGAFSNKAATDPAPGGGTTTFDPSNLGTGNALSGGNLIATTSITGTSGEALARSITSHTTGKFYFEIQMTATFGTGNWMIGIVTGSTPLQGTFPGLDANLSVTCYNNPNGWYVNSVNNANCGSAPSVGDWLGVAVDYTDSLIWIRDATVSSTTWNAGGTANPTTGIGGQSISAITCPCYAAYGAYTQVGGSGTGTANFGGSAYAATAPVGYGNY